MYIFIVEKPKYRTDEEQQSVEVPSILRDILLGHSNDVPGTQKTHRTEVDEIAYESVSRSAKMICASCDNRNLCDYMYRSLNAMSEEKAVQRRKILLSILEGW